MPLIIYYLYIIHQLYAKDKHVLLIVGEDDMTVNPQYLKSFYKSYPSDRRHLIEFCMYPGAGHLIEPPYSPLSRSTRRYVKSIMSLPGKQACYTQTKSSFYLLFNEGPGKTKSKLAGPWIA